MKDELIKYNTAVLAKEKGFNVDCEENYNEDEELTHNFSTKPAIYSAPTQSLLQRWLRERHNIHLIIQSTFGATDTYITFVNREIIKDESRKDLKEVGDLSGIMLDHKLFNSYEEALEIGLYEALKLIKTK